MLIKFANNYLDAKITFLYENSNRFISHEVCFSFTIYCKILSLSHYLIKLCIVVNVEKISVIIPVYNTEKYVETTVRSIMNQTYDNLEIICVNDGSTDGSLEILKKLQDGDKRITIIDKANGGLGDARNYGLKNATAEWISFIDSDDFLEPETYEIIMNKTLGYNPDMIHFGLRIVQEEKVGNKRKDENYYSFPYDGLEELNDEMRIKLDASSCNKMFRKSIIEKYDLHFENIHYEDYQFVMQYRCVVEKVYFVPDKLYNYLRRGSSIMAETFKGSPRSIDHLYAFHHIVIFLQRIGILRLHSDILCKMFAQCYYFSMRNADDTIISSVVDYALGLHSKYDFLRDRFEVTKKKGTLLFEDRKTPKKHNVVSSVLSSVFAIKRELI